MATDIDPEGRELQAIAAAADLRGARVLEIGCGGGRLTARYAARARVVLGLDPDRDSVAAARRLLGATGRAHVVQAGAGALPCRDGAFDRALFAWSL